MMHIRIEIERIDGNDLTEINQDANADGFDVVDNNGQWEVVNQ
ncbi:hypothetical protein THIOSC15_2720022 [uncultured Thiomicrorhabdus sp.]